jgi:hypothetical protein
LSWTVGTWEPEDYESLVNEFKFEYIFNSNSSKLPFYTHWLLFDISDVKYKNLNSKGLFTYAGLPKDCSFLWKAKARPQSPLVWIAGKHWYMRTTGPNVKVYSNRPSITLNVNGASQGAKTDGAYTHPSGGAVIHNVFLFNNVLSKGKNTVIADGGSGATDTAIIYYAGTASSTAPADNGEYITGLTSSSASNPAYYINMPVQAQWPVYYQCDGNADNTFDSIPAMVSGARWIATKRQSASATTLSFTISSSLKNSADVFVMLTQQSAAPSWLTSAGFTNTNVACRWRDNSMTLVNCQLYKKTVAPGVQVSVGSSAIDFVVLVKSNDGTGIGRTNENKTSIGARSIRVFAAPGGASEAKDMFLHNGIVDIYDLSGRRVGCSLNKTEFMSFYKNMGAAGQMYIVKTSGKL